MHANSLDINEPSALGTADWRKVMMWIVLVGRTGDAMRSTTYRRTHRLVVSVLSGAMLVGCGPTFTTNAPTAVAMPTPALGPSPCPPLGAFPEWPVDPVRGADGLCPARPAGPVAEKTPVPVAP